LLGVKEHDLASFLFFTAHPGITRGGHYHMLNTENFGDLKERRVWFFSFICDAGVCWKYHTSGEQPKSRNGYLAGSTILPIWATRNLVGDCYGQMRFDRQRPDYRKHKSKECFQ